MICLGQTSALGLLFVLLVACQLQVDGKPVDTVKELAKTMVQSAGEKAQDVPDAPPSDSVRATALNAGLSFAADHIVNAVGVKYPSVKVAAPVVKLGVLHAKNAINNIFAKKPDESVENKEGGEKVAVGDSKENVIAEEGDQKDEPQQGGFFNKIKSAMGTGDAKAETKAEKAPQDPKNNGEDSDEKKPDEKAGAKAGEDKDAKEEKVVEENDKAAEKEDSPVKEKEPEKEEAQKGEPEKKEAQERESEKKEAQVEEKKPKKEEAQESEPEKKEPQVKEKKPEKKEAQVEEKEPKKEEAQESEPEKKETKESKPEKKESQLEESKQKSSGKKN